jgi:VWFA-related protein
MSSMQVADQLRALSGAQKFLVSQITPSDLVAIMEFSDGTVKVRQDFTGDRDLLLSTINKIVAVAQGIEDQDYDAGAAFGQDEGEFNIFNTDRQLSALQTAFAMLGRVNEKKALVYFASGIRLNGVDNQAQLRATLNAAVRANVAFFPVDSRGLVAAAPMGDASVGSQGGLSMYTGGAAMSMASSLQRSQDALYALAADSGGKATFDYNDLSMGIVEAQKATSNYYILGYYPTPARKLASSSFTVTSP